jgi:ribosome maturation factor RimP
MYRDIPKALREAIEPIVRAHGLELVDAALRAGPGRSRLVVVIDTAQGDGRVLVDQCAAVSREIGYALDGLDLVPGAYMLEVTSPGVDRTLAREVDFERAVGRKIALETREPLEGRRRFRGELESFSCAEALVHTDGGSVRIPFAKIARATAFHPLPAPAGRKR